MTFEVEGSEIRRFELTHPPGEGQRALALLDGFERMSTQERKALRATLLPEVSRQRCLGTRRSAYGGTVRAFEAGLAWTAPRGFWDLCKRSEGAAGTVVFEMEEVEEGVSMQVESDPRAELALSEELDAFSRGRTLYDQGTLDVDGVELEWRLLSGSAGGGLWLRALADYGGRRVRWTAISIRDTPSLRRLMTESLERLRIDPDLPAFEVVDERFVDHRYGLALEGPAGTAPEHLADSNQIVWDSADASFELSSLAMSAEDHLLIWAQLDSQLGGQSAELSEPWTEVEIDGQRAWSTTDLLTGVVFDAIDHGGWSHLLVYDGLGTSEIAAIRASIDLL